MKLRNLLANKNVVTILGAILIVIVLYAFYNWRVNQAISPIRVPYAKVAIGPRTEITSEMIAYLDIQEAALKGNVLTNPNTQIVGMYTNVNSTIPQGSMFYKEALVRFEDLPDSYMIEMPDDMVPYNFSVNMKSTYSNSIYPGNIIDIYFKAVDNGKIIVGKLASNVKVYAVRDSNGINVFENINDNRSPAQIILGVTKEMHEMLRVAEYISNAEIIIVPTNKSYKEDANEIVTEITSDELRAFIEANRA